MTKAKHDKPEEGKINWKYSSAQRRAIRTTLGERLTDHDYYQLIKSLEYRINHDSDFATS